MISYDINTEVQILNLKLMNSREFMIKMFIATVIGRKVDPNRAWLKKDNKEEIRDGDSHVQFL